MACSSGCANAGNRRTSESGGNALNVRVEFPDGGLFNQLQKDSACSIQQLRGQAALPIGSTCNAIRAFAPVRFGI